MKSFQDRLKSLPRGRRPLRFALALVASTVAISAVPASSGAVTVGIGDQLPKMFSNSYFKALHIHNGRLTVPWNVAVSSQERSALAGARTWLADAKADGVTPLISFSRVGNSSRVPSVKQYTSAVKAFIKDFPYIKLYTAWNEPDWVYIPFAKNPKLAAQYFNALVHVCKGCTVAAGDVYIGGNALKKWLQGYTKELAKLHDHPKAWALHNYYDIRGHNTAQLKIFEKYTKGQIWLDEISGVEFRAHWPFPKSQSAQAAASDEAFLFSLPKKFHRITRIYHYMWQASTTPDVWDSGLLDESGNPRPAYYVVQKAAQ